jgi:hypothetical protein
LFLLFILSLGELGGNPSRLDGIEIGRAVSISGRRVTLCPLPGFVFFSNKKTYSYQSLFKFKLAFYHEMSSLAIRVQRCVHWVAHE